MKAMYERHLREKYGIDSDDGKRIVLLLSEKIEDLEVHLLGGAEKS